MQKKNTNHLLLNTFFDIDLLIVKKDINFLNSFKTIKVTQKKEISILNPLEIFIRLKQFIRLIQFFKKQNNSLINFFVQGLHQKNLINSFIKVNNININFKIFFKFLILKKQKFQFLLAIDKSITNNSNYISNILLRENTFLVQEINSLSAQKNYGTYKLYNNLFDYKKLIFILIIISQILKKAPLQKKIIPEFKK